MQVVGDGGFADAEQLGDVPVAEAVAVDEQHRDTLAWFNIRSALTIASSNSGTLAVAHVG